jgi:hypothetical protein
MPQIPTWQPLQIGGNRLSPGGVSVPQPPGGVRASADVFNGTGEAAASIAKAAESWANTAAAFNKARLETTYQNEKIAATAKISAFEQSLVGRSDWDRFEPEFNALAESMWKDHEQRIQDPEVVQALKAHLSGLILQRSAQVSKLARDKEIEWGKGAYADRQAEYLNLFAVSRDPTEPLQ